MSGFRRAVPATPPHPPRRAGGGAVSGGGEVGAGARNTAPTAAAPASTPPVVPVVAASVPGTRRWVDGSLLLSTGLKEVDVILGGGVAVGSAVLVEMDGRGVHSHTLLQYVAAEGVACGHRVMVAGRGDDPAMQHFVTTLPVNASREGGNAPLAGDSTSATTAAGAGAVKIAAEYVRHAGTTAVPAAAPAAMTQGSDGGGAPHPPASASLKYCHTFDLNRHMSLEQLCAADVHALHVSPTAGGTASGGGSMYCNLATTITARWAATPAAVPCRIIIPLLGGPRWPGFTGPIGCETMVNYGATCPAQPIAFPGGPTGLPVEALLSSQSIAAHRPLLSCLSRLIDAVHHAGASGVGAGGGSAYPVLCVGMPLHLYPLPISAAIRAMFDIVIKVHAFGDPPACLLATASGAMDPVSPTTATGTAPEFADYTGLFLVRKLSRPGACAVPLPDTFTFVFKRDRRKMVVEKPHLPPELEAPSGGGAAPATPAEGGGGTQDMFDGDSDEVEVAVGSHAAMEGGSLVPVTGGAPIGTAAKAMGLSCATSGGGGRVSGASNPSLDF